ncbi:hypothetical protein HHI36_023002, partial [Cryptolaemus montrouzieri]
RDNVGNLSTDNKTSASIFVDTFSKAFSREPAGPLPKISTRRNENTISDVTISPELVEAAIKELKSNSCPGLDEISVKLYKSCSSSLIGPLSQIMSTSLKTHSLPSCWTKASVTPVFRKGDKCSENYRPISMY